jgi:hypothetical protein
MKGGAGIQVQIRKAEVHSRRGVSGWIVILVGPVVRIEGDDKSAVAIANERPFLNQGNCGESDRLVRSALAEERSPGVERDAIVPVVPNSNCGAGQDGKLGATFQVQGRDRVVERVIVIALVGGCARKGVTQLMILAYFSPRLWRLVRALLLLQKPGQISP